MVEAIPLVTVIAVEEEIVVVEEVSGDGLLGVEGEAAEGGGSLPRPR